MNEPLKFMSKPAVKHRMRRAKGSHHVDRDHLLTEFNMISEEMLAALFQVEVKTLKNRDPVDLPPFSKVGGKRLFFKNDVMEFMRKRMNFVGSPQN